MRVSMLSMPVAPFRIIPIDLFESWRIKYNSKYVAEQTQDWSLESWHELYLSELNHGFYLH